MFKTTTDPLGYESTPYYSINIRISLGYIVNLLSISLSRPNRFLITARDIVNPSLITNEPRKRIYQEKSREL